MKIYPFKVQHKNEARALELILAEAVDIKLEDRICVFFGTPCRLETVELKDGLWFLDFVNIRTNHGPAKGSRKEAVESFDLDSEQGFCEETAAVYDPKTRYIVIQYNHHGPRHTAVEQWFNSRIIGEAGEYELLPKLRDDIHSKLKTKKIFKRVDFRVDRKHLTQEDYKNNLGISDALKIASNYGADRVTITVANQATNAPLSSKMASALASWLLKMAHEKEGAVLHAEVVAAEGPPVGTGEKHKPNYELLDLVAHRLCAEEEMVAGEGKRFSQVDRWKALKAAFVGWKTQLAPDDGQNA